METTGGPLIISDSQFKTDVTDLNGSLKLSLLVILWMFPIIRNSTLTNIYNSDPLSICPFSLIGIQDEIC